MDENSLMSPEDLRLARLAARLRQRDVAERVGVAPQRVSDYENGVRRPAPEVMERLRQVLSEARRSVRAVNLYGEEGTACR